MKWPIRNGPTAPKLTAIAAATLLLAGTSHTAFAGGTASNTTISNQANLSYSVGGVNQADILSDGDLGTAGIQATTFLVDKKVDVLVVEANSTFTSVTPGQTGAVTTFTVTNQGNDTQDFALTTANIVGGVVHGGTDNFDATACAVFVESGATLDYQPLQDTATFIDELAADASQTAYVVCSIPGGQVNGDQANVSLTATTRAAGVAATLGAVLTPTAGANTAGVDTVFADDTGTDDANRDAASSARDAYRIASAILSVSKTATLVCDPVNGTTNPKNIPGAIVRWTVTVSNGAGAGASATLAQVTDALNANTTFDNNLVTGAVVAADCDSATGTPEDAAGSGFKLDVTGDTRPGTYPKFLTTVADPDAGTHAAGTVTIDYSLGLPVEVGYTAGELKAGEAAVVYFNVTVN
jgi:methylmalonyl-CoA mutase cobalamin-binding subunit